MTNLPARRSLLTTLANRYELEPKKLLETLKATVFENRATEAEMIAFLTVAKNYDLDPFRNEIYAFRKQGGGIQPLVGIDGWLSVSMV